MNAADEDGNGIENIGKPSASDLESGWLEQQGTPVGSGGTTVGSMAAGAQMPERTDANMTSAELPSGDAGTGISPTGDDGLSDVSTRAAGSLDPSNLPGQTLPGAMSASSDDVAYTHPDDFTAEVPRDDLEEDRNSPS